LESTLSFQLLINALGDFDETWHKESSHCVDVHIIREALIIVCKRVIPLGLIFYFEKYFVFVTLSKPFEDFF
jgi:hypothetical protein